MCIPSCWLLSRCYYVQFIWIDVRNYGEEISINIHDGESCKMTEMAKEEEWGENNSDESNISK